MCLEQPLALFHAQVTRVFNPLPETDPEINKVCVVFLRFITLLTAPIVYPLLMSVALLGWSITALTSCFISEVTIEALNLNGRIAAIRGEPGWQEAAMRLIRTARKEDPQIELDRLRTIGILNAENEYALDAAIADASKIQAKVLMAQAMEIREIYKTTHHVLIHAQATKWIAYCHLVKELFKVRHPEVDVHQFKFLRVPSEPENEMTIDEYLAKLWFVFDESKQDRQNLISASAYFPDATVNESALYFLKQNTNIAAKPVFIENATKHAIRHFYQAIPDKTLNYFMRKILRTFNEPYPCGNLFTFCLPKEISPNIQKRAHPYGHVCKCHPKEESSRIIEKLEEGQLDVETRCGGLGAMSLAGIVPTPQFRIHAPGLKPETGIKIFLLTPMAKAVRKQHKSTIRDVVRTIEKVSKDWTSRVA